MEMPGVNREQEILMRYRTIQHASFWEIWHERIRTPLCTVAAVIPHSSATLSCPSHAESCRKQLPCQQPHINNHTLQQRRQRWKQCVWMFVCESIAVKTVLVCIYNTWSQRERERRCVHVSSHSLSSAGYRSCLNAHSRGRDCVYARVCVRVCVYLLIFNLQRGETRLQLLKPEKQLGLHLRQCGDLTHLKYWYTLITKMSTFNKRQY